MAKKTTETVDESILDPSKIAVNSDTVDNSASDEAPAEDTIAPISEDADDTTDKEGEEGNDTLGIPRPPVVVPDVFGSGKDEDPFDSDELEVKIGKASGLEDNVVKGLIDEIKNATDADTKDDAIAHLVWHIPAGAGCEHYDELVEAIKAL